MLGTTEMKINSTSNQTPYLVGLQPCCTQKPDYKERLLKIVYPIMKEIQYPNMKQTDFGFSDPIYPSMGFATYSSIRICPLFVIDLPDIPPEIRPEGWDDPRLCDLDYLQRLSNWIAEECDIPKQKVSFAEAAAAKTIIKLKQDPEGYKALRAGIVHQMGHVALGHSDMGTKSVREKVKEADLYAAIHLSDGLEGIKIGFKAWQESLQAVRSSSGFNWKDRIIMHLLITPQGNFLPRYFTHGFFETRIQQAEQGLKAWNSKKPKEAVLVKRKN